MVASGLPSRIPLVISSGIHPGFLRKSVFLFSCFLSITVLEEYYFNGLSLRILLVIISKMTLSVSLSPLLEMYSTFLSRILSEFRQEYFERFWVGFRISPKHHLEHNPRNNG